MIGFMALSISEVAKHRRSAIRYYERLGILSSAHIASGQRRYDATAPHRLTKIQS